MSSLYSTLDSSKEEIRLVELLPATNTSDDVVCNLRTASVASKHEYIALSYVWGNPTVTSCITVNDSPFQATVNLVSALRHIRLANKSVLLWVDALCINQRDDAEKSIQIQLMRQIYHGAQTVTVWLGESDAHSDRAMSILITAARILATSIETSGNGFDEMAVFLKTVTQEESMMSLRSFLDRDWFRRIWVIQEVVVARQARFMCSYRTICFEDFKLVYKFWVTLIGTVPRPLPSELVALEGLLHGSSFKAIVWQSGNFHNRNGITFKEATTLEYMLQRCLAFDSTDPRDKVYAWLGLLPANDVRIIPDYSATVVQVYVDLVRAVMEHSASLSPISFAGSSARPRQLAPICGLPSWVPDLRKDACPRAPGSTFWFTATYFKASSTMQANATISSDGLTLITDGLLIGTLVTIESNKHDNQDQAVEEKVCRWLDTALGASKKPSARIADICEAFFRTLICCGYEPYSVFPVGPDYFEICRAETAALRMGFMAYVGYLTRIQDCLEWSVAHPDRQTSYQLETVEYLSASLRDETISARFPRRRNTSLIQQRNGPPSQPMWHDLENITRFLQLWDINMSDTDPEKFGPFVEVLQEFTRALDSDLQSRVWQEADWPEPIRQRGQQTLRHHVHEYYSKVKVTTRDRSFFITDGGNFGLSTTRARLGDRTCIVRGCPVPLLIREHELGDGFEVIGKCYVSGCMFGECIEAMDTESRKWRKLRFK